MAHNLRVKVLSDGYIRDKNPKQLGPVNNKTCYNLALIFVRFYLLLYITWYKIIGMLSPNNPYFLRKETKPAEKKPVLMGKNKLVLRSPVIVKLKL